VANLIRDVHDLRIGDVCIMRQSTVPRTILAKKQIYIEYRVGNGKGSHCNERPKAELWSEVWQVIRDGQVIYQAEPTVEDDDAEIMALLMTEDGEGVQGG